MKLFTGLEWPKENLQKLDEAVKIFYHPNWEERSLPSVRSADNRQILYCWRQAGKRHVQ